MSNVKHRHRSRRLALQALCCLDVQGERVMDLALDFIRQSEEPLEAIFHAEGMLAGAWAHRRQADALLAEHSHHWDLRRMPLVDRNILRLAIWELTQRTAPLKVIINEAIRLAQEYSTAESPRFVNGILDAAARQLGESPASPPPPDGRVE